MVPNPCISVEQVIFTVLGCIPLFEMYPTYLFAFGALLVTLSVALYGLSPEQSAEYCAALHIREPQWLQSYRTSASAQLLRDRFGYIPTQTLLMWFQ